jgi:hypothetical protein
VPERAGESFLGGVFRRCSVETADLEGTHEPWVVNLVDLDEVWCYDEALVSWYGDSLAQGGSDLRRSPLNLGAGRTQDDGFEPVTLDEPDEPPEEPEAPDAGSIGPPG